MNSIIEILIFTRSVVLLQGLGALLESMSDIKSVTGIRELASAYEWIDAHQPKIVFLDADVLGSNPKTVLEKIQIISPGTQRVLLVDDMQKAYLMPEYAEAILIKGVSPSALTSIIANLLSEKGDEDEHNDTN